MPAKPLWLLHIPEIIDQLEACDLPVLDRASFEQAFRLRRRRAIELMHGFGGYQAGRTFLIDRHVVIQRLKELAAGEEFLQETARKERLENAIGQFRRDRVAANVKIPVEPDVLSARMANLPAGVVLQPGTLQVKFSDPEDLLRKMFRLAQAVSNDYEGFEGLTAVSVQRTAEGPYPAERGWDGGSLPNNVA